MKSIKYALLLVLILFSVNFIIAETGNKHVSDSTSDDLTGEVIILNKADFLKKIYNYEKNKEKWVYEDTIPCIIDFYADWCGPCKIVDPILKQLAKDYKGKIIIYKINVDNERELARAFRIGSIPTYLFIPAKGDPQPAMGAMPRESFVKIIDEFLLKKPD